MTEDIAVKETESEPPEGTLERVKAAHGNGSAWSATVAEVSAGTTDELSAASDDGTGLSTDANGSDANGSADEHADGTDANGTPAQDAALPPAVPPKDAPAADGKQNGQNGQQNGQNGQNSAKHSRFPSTDSASAHRPAGSGHRHTSAAMSVSSTSSGQHTVSSMVFVKKALKEIAASKDMRKLAPLEAAVQKALAAIEESAEPPALTVFEPFRIVCTKSSNPEIKVVALDTIAKLVSFSYLEDPVALPVDPASGITPPPVVPMIDQVVNTVCDAYAADATDPAVEMQIIKALMAAVVNEDAIAHGQTLLSAIRQTYNISVKSHYPANQGWALASLSQMVNAVFDRVKTAAKKTEHSGMASARSSVANLGMPSPENAEPAAPVDTEPAAPADTEPAAPAETEPAAPTDTAPAKMTLSKMMETQEELDDEGHDDGSQTETFAKDAFLVFRTMCKLTFKTLDPADENDLKSQGMRSKLLALHLVHTIIKSHISVFLSKDIVIHTRAKGAESFISASKDYINNCIARNATSISPAVFEVTVEIFWLVLSNLRAVFKGEIEVCFGSIYFSVAESPLFSMHQKLYLLSIFQKLCSDPRALVELYLNYDCDKNATVNIFEQLLAILSKLSSTNVPMSHMQLQQYHENKHKVHAVYNLRSPPSLSLQHAANHVPEVYTYPIEYALKISALDALVSVVKSLNTWSQKNVNAIISAGDEVQSVTPAASSANGLEDDPAEFESLRNTKRSMLEVIKEFNYKPKRGMQLFFEKGLATEDPKDVARLLFTTEGIDKEVLGAYLGEGDQFNKDVMHEFIDLMDFKNLSFVDAIRILLQAFRLPGESQKIDRFMLKFAERYLSDNPDSVFANAEAAYVLAYSVIMLNTDQHSPQVKRRMTLEDFVRNNRGINDHGDLPRDFMEGVFNEIKNDEIKLISEQYAALLAQDTSANTSNFGILGTVGRNIQRDLYMEASREMTNKTEKLFKGLVSGDQAKVFYFASHVEHVKPMFEVCWMSVLVALSNVFQETEDADAVKISLEGFWLAMRISCIFDVDLARKAFVKALCAFTNLQNTRTVKSKNAEVVKIVLQIALSNGNTLHDSWLDILTSVSQLERYQLLCAGINASAIPDVTNARVSRNSSESTRTTQSRGSFFGRSSAQPTHALELPPVILPEIAEILSSREFIVSMDKIFTQSAKLSGEAIVEFVKALTEVSSEEIASSGHAEVPRMFSLQKMVDVSYYNMDRIRVEWSQLWSIMGAQFKIVGCHPNINIVTFALDSLRQLAIRFFDLDELPHFKFQLEFLKPFEYVMANNDNLAAKDMVMSCVHQMILTKSDRIRSGWKTIFNTFTAAAHVSSISLVQQVFNLTRQINTNDEWIKVVIQQDSFEDMVNLLTELSKNEKFQKIALQSIDLLKSVITKLENMDSLTNQEKYYLPVLLALQNVIMNGEDLEVRSRALNYLFDILTALGSTFSDEFWDSICRRVLFPIFVILKSKSDMAKSKTQDETGVWLSTTMIQALRNMIALLSNNFVSLSRMLDGFLDLLVTCILQDNDTVSKIGASCLIQLCEDNAERLTESHWDLITGKLEYLFQHTTANELFDEFFDEESDSTPSKSSSSSSSPKSLSHKKGHKANHSGQHNGKQGRFLDAIVKSVLQLLMIGTVQELFSNDEVYKSMPLNDLIRLSKLMQHSYEFSCRFNADKQLRQRLFKQGFMKQMPNLLRQESSAALVYVSLMMKLFMDDIHKFTSEEKENVRLELIPLCLAIIKSYNALQVEEQRYIATLNPVVVKILLEFVHFPPDDFTKTLPSWYPELIGLLDKEMTDDLREALKTVLLRVGEVAIKRV